MAAYAAFKHVELYNVGKAKKRVLRPPGGGSSDIFGSDMPQTPRNVKNRMVSNIFSADKDGSVKNNGDAPRRAQKNVDSYSRLFGEPSRPITPAKNHMKSSIPFGQNKEASRQLLSNANGHYNGKSGSVSSASSSVSSSTENLKMNGVSRSEDQNIQELPVLRPNSACPSKLQQQSAEIIRTPDILETDLPCNKNTVGDIPDTNYLYTESDKRDVHLQTRKDMHTVTERPYSLDKMAPSSGADVGSCPDYAKPSESPCTYSKQSMCARNPITGSGLNGDGVGGLKPKKLKNREGNPVTGEGYKPGATDYNQPASLNGSNQVINKNRVPPGGYSSGLW